MKLKYLLSGNVLEVYQYQRVIVGKGGAIREVGKEGSYKEKNYQQTTMRRREYVRRLALANFGRGDLFVTLTFAENQTDVQEANRAFRLFIMRLRRRYPGVQYLAVIEFQKRGAVHYHVLINQSYIDQDALAKIWGQGFVWINSISHVDNIGAYLVKYMSKEHSDSRLMGQDGYLCSHGLKRWETFTEWEAGRADREKRHPYLKSARRALLANLRAALGKVDHVYSSFYESDYVGCVLYVEYNLDRMGEGSEFVKDILDRLRFGNGKAQSEKCFQPCSELIKKVENRVELISPLRL